MKFILLTLAVVSLLLGSACPELKNSVVNSKDKMASPTPKVENSLDKKSNSLNQGITVFDLILAPFEKNQKKITGRVFSIYGSAKIKKDDEFDIMNEYGFLGKGRFVKYVNSTKEKDGYWVIETAKNNVRPDIDELSFTRMGEMEKEYPILPAYGVFPSKSERRNIRSGGKVDMSEKGTSERQLVFQSLPKEIQDGSDVYNERRELEYPNRWSDFDGDGKIDFVYVRVRCSEEPHSHCGKYLHLLDGKWIELPEKIGEN